MVEPGQSEILSSRVAVGRVRGGKIVDSQVLRGGVPKAQITALRGEGAEIQVRGNRKDGRGWQISFADKLAQRQAQPPDEKRPEEIFSIVEQTEDKTVVDVPATAANEGLLRSLSAEVELGERGNVKELHTDIPQGVRRFVLPRGVVTKK